MPANDTILIITGGSIDEEFAKNYILTHTFSKIIAVDGGLKLVDKLGIKIDHIVGDFDTVSEKLLDKYKSISSRPIIHQYNPEKDATDTHIAIDLAITFHPTKIIILAATGTRLDHTIANIQLLKYPFDKDIFTSIINETNQLYLINRTYYLKKSEMNGDFLSLLPFTDIVKGVTLKGFKYPLLNKTIEKGDSLGVSNEIIEDHATIELDYGILLVCETKDSL